jgi:hypothetical protein
MLFLRLTFLVLPVTWMASELSSITVLFSSVMVPLEDWALSSWMPLPELSYIRLLAIRLLPPKGWARMPVTLS